MGARPSTTVHAFAWNTIISPWNYAVVILMPLYLWGSFKIASDKRNVFFKESDKVKAWIYFWTQVPVRSLIRSSEGILVIWS